MNLKLFPNEVKVDFIVGNKELFRIPDEIKQISFNKSGSLVGISTKLNKFYIYDYFGYNIIGIILYFHEKRYKIKNFCFNNINNLYIAYEYILQGNIINSCIKEINLEKVLKKIIHSNINNKDEYIIPISEEDKSEHQVFNELTNAKIFEILFENEKLLICGNNPYIYDLNTKNILYFIKQELISLLPITSEQLKNPKDLQIFIDSSDKNIKNNEKNEGKDNEEIYNNNNNNTHFIITDLDSIGQNGSIQENKNEIVSINNTNKNNKDTDNVESNIMNNIQNNENNKEVDININNNNISNNDDYFLFYS